MEQLVAQAEAPRRCAGRRSPARRCSSPTRPTRPPAAAAPPPRSTRCGDVFGDDADRIVIANTKGFTGHPMGVGLEDVARGQGARDGRRPAGAELPRSRPRAGRAQPLRRRRLPGPLRAAAGGRLRLADLRCCSCAGRRSPTAAGATPTSSATTTGSPIAPRGPRGCGGSAATRTRSSRSCSTGCASSIRVRPRPAAGARRGAGRRAGGDRRPPRWRPSRAAAPPATPAPSRRPAAPSPRRPAPAAAMSSSGCWRSWPSRPAIRRTCSTWTSTSRPTWGSTRSSRPRCSRRSARPTGSSATTRSSCATTRPSTTSSGSSTSAPAPRRRRRAPAAAAAGRAGPAPEPAPAAAGGDVEQRVLAIVAEQTGYPPDLLDLDLDLEADLGIDTVKQAEVFATIREAYGIERDDSLKLRDYPTLNHVVGVRQRAHRGAAPAGARAGRAGPGRAGRRRPSRAGRAAGDDVEQRVLAIVAEQTGYPPDLLDLDLDLEADLGIDTVKQAEVFATIREAYGIERDDSLKLRDYPTLNHVVGFVHERARARRPRPRRRAGPRPSRRRRPSPRRPAPPATRSSERVLAIVAEQTGYPPDLLDMDLDLEADLGIDTVKQAEVFATIREAYGIERDDSLKLRDYPTLNHVVGVRQRARRAPAPSRARAGAAEPSRRGRARGRRAPDGASRGASRCRSCARRSTAACRPASSSATGSRVVLMPDARRRRRGAGQAARASSASRCSRSTARPTPRSSSASSPTGGRRADPGRLLAARARRRGRRSPARPRRLARGAARAREAAGGRRCARSPSRSTAGHVPRRRHPPRRPPRLRRGRRDVGRWAAP